MISVYGGDQRTGEPGRPDVPDYPDIPELPGTSGASGPSGDFRGLPEPPGQIHRYWMAGLEILDDGLMNTAWQANR